MKLKDNLYFRVFIPFLFALVFIAGLVWWVSTTLIYQTLENRLSQQLQHTSAMLIDGKFPLTLPVMQQLSQLLEADVYLFNEAEDDLYTNSLNVAAVKALINTKNSANEANAISGDVKIREVEISDQYYILVSRKFSRLNSGYSSMVALASLGKIQSEVNAAAFKLGALVLGILAIMAWLGHRSIKRFTLPIIDLSLMAKEIAGGNRAIQLHIDQKNEIGDLATALNTMTLKLQAYEADLVQKSRLASIGELAAKVAHEVRNPLTAMKLQIQLLLESCQPEQQKMLGQLLNEVRRLELIVSSVLDQSRPIALNTQCLNLNEIIEDFCDLFDAQMKHRNITIIKQLSVIPDGMFDRNRIIQVITNLVLNAADELKSSGSILIRSGHDKRLSQILLVIEDSGNGISEVDKQQLFAPFESSKPYNMGLGLAICKEIIALHDGKIMVSDSDLGGAKFSVHLPYSIKKH